MGKAIKIKLRGVDKETAKRLAQQLQNVLSKMTGTSVTTSITGESSE